MNERLQQQLAFLAEIDKSKEILRQTYLADGSRKENDAEHGWHMALMALTLREYFGESLDTLKTVQMILMHDLVEIYAGDTYCYDQQGIQSQEERELAAAEKIYGLLPIDQRETYQRLWREFEEKKTREALCAAVMDRLQPMLLQFQAKGKSWKEHGIRESQVRKRQEFTLAAAPPELAEYVNWLLDESVKRGYLPKDELKEDR